MGKTHLLHLCPKSAKLPKSLLKKVKHLATDQEKSDTEIFNEALKEYLKGRDQD